MQFLTKKVAGVILAAGSASRMGRTKQLLPFGRGTLLGQVLENAQDSALQEIILVLGHDAEAISKNIDLSAVKVVWNKAFAHGQSTSLISGLDRVSANCEAAMFILADQPLVSAAIINELLAAFNATDLPIVIPYFQGKRGNPVIIARSLFDQLRTLKDDIGARGIFDKFQEQICPVHLKSKAILVDVDTEEDYLDLISKQNQI